MNEIKISICIPTRNRAGFIGDSLESIVSQANDNIEIVIVDGASTDNTAEVVQRYQREFKNLIYWHGEVNMGVDRDMKKAIELARGKYCWLFSDDDMLKPGAIKRMLNEIELGYEIYLCNVTACSLDMQPIRQRYWLSRKVRDRVFNLHEKKDLIEYCNKANSIGALFSFWSSIVLSRQEWNKVGYNYDFDGSAYASASVLFSFTKQRCRLKYIRNSLVLWRNDNESFQNEGGLVKRFYLDFDGYLKLADKFLSDEEGVKSSFLKVMTREHPWYTVINVASFINDTALWEDFRAKLLRFGYSRKMVTTCYCLSRHKGLVSLGVAIKRKLIKGYQINKF